VEIGGSDIPTPSTSLEIRGLPPLRASGLSLLYISNNIRFKGHLLGCISQRARLERRTTQLCSNYHRNTSNSPSRRTSRTLTSYLTRMGFSREALRHF
jgi:hypothetical protein